MTYQRRVVETHIDPVEATGSHELDAMRAADAPLAEFVKAGGLRGFSTKQMFPEQAA